MIDFIDIIIIVFFMYDTMYGYSKHVLSLMLTPAKIIFSHTYQDLAKFNDNHIIINFRHHHDLRV